MKAQFRLIIIFFKKVTWKHSERFIQQAMLFFDVILFLLLLFQALFKVEALLFHNIVLISGSQQSDSCTHTHVLSIQLFSLIGYYKILSRIPCAVQQFLVGIYFLHSNVFICSYILNCARVNCMILFVQPSHHACSQSVIIPCLVLNMRLPEDK